MRFFTLSGFWLILCLAGPAGSEPRIQVVTAEGYCAVVGMTAEQAGLTARQRARAAAIEQAAGVRVSSSTLVVDGQLAADFIRSYSRGFIVREEAEWLPLGEHRVGPEGIPVPEYRVRITAHVQLPRRPLLSYGLKASLNRTVFRAGETAVVTASVGRPAHVGIFNIAADDTITMLYPNPHIRDRVVEAGHRLVFPAPEAEIELVLQNLPGRERDSEAFLVAALDPEAGIRFMDLFPALEPMPFAEFFSRYARAADAGEDVILTYEVAAR